MNQHLHNSTTDRTARRPRTIWAGVALSVMALAACGDDDDDAASTDAPAASAAPSTDAATDTTPDTTGPAVSAELADYCALALEITEQESLPTAEQLTRYLEIAPPEIVEVATAAADVMIPVADDQVAMFNLLADDEISATLDELTAFETVTCGFDSEEPPIAAGSSTEIEADATRVDVVATDYAFEVEPTLAAGRTSFVLTNEGAEAHFMALSKLKEGVTMTEALAMEDPSSVLEGEWGTELAASGGTDEEVITFDLEPGTYAMLCFIPNADGVPHAFMGMATEVTVS